MWIVDEEAPLKRTPKILRVTLDTQFTFGPHARYCIEWASRALRVMKVFSSHLDKLEVAIPEQGPEDRDLLPPKGNSVQPENRNWFSDLTTELYSTKHLSNFTKQSNSTMVFTFEPISFLFIYSGIMLLYMQLTSSLGTSLVPKQITIKKQSPITKSSYFQSFRWHFLITFIYPRCISSHHLCQCFIQQ